MLRRPFPFGGSWLDSLEILVVDNAGNDSRHKKKLKLLEQKLKNRDKMLRFCLNCFSQDQRKLMMFKRQRKHVKSKLAKVMKKRKVVSDARKSLEFFYPT
ncbi:hypothetical protein TSUD_41050 [Trifolium subterraneum]|nr:hypothetical protein TSUD_41050 [Trifolium subterraneum]